MKTDKITKLLLGVIALNLSVMTVKELTIVPQVYAGDAPKAMELNSMPNYGLVPLNKDGSISVSLSNADKIDVRVVDEVKVNISRFSSYESLGININKVGSSTVYNSLPIQIKD